MSADWTAAVAALRGDVQGLADRVAVLEARETARRLSPADRDRLTQLLPVVAANLGSAPFKTSELIDHPAIGLRLVLGDLSALRLGRLLARADLLPIGNYLVEKIGTRGTPSSGTSSRLWIEVSGDEPPARARTGLVVIVPWGQENPAMITRSISALPPGTAFARYLKGVAFGADYARQFLDTPQVARGLELISKATIGGLTTGDAPDLVEVGVFDPATAQLLAGVSALEAALPRMRRVPFNTATPRETSAGSGGGWVAEGAPKPVISFMFDTLRLQPVACASIFACTEELLRAQGAETVIRDAALAAVGRTETTLFLDPASSPIGHAPGAITFGQPTVTPTGNMAADLASMLAVISTSGSGLVWIMRLPDLAYVASALGGMASGLPTSLLGVPIILVPTAPTGLVTLADLSAIAYAAGPLEVTRSEQATVEMDSAPSNAVAGGSPAAPVPTQTVSLWQNNAIAFKLSRFLSWSVVRDTAVVTMTLNAGSPA